MRIVLVQTWLWFASCLPLAVHPVYTSSDLTFDTSLVGVWVDKKTGATYDIGKGRERSYLVSVTTPDEAEGLFKVHLLSLAKKMYLDVFPANAGKSSDEIHRSLLYPMHTFLRLDSVASAVYLSPLSTVWLARNSGLPCVDTLPQPFAPFLLVTCSTSEQQAMLRSLADKEEAFGSQIVLVEPK